MNRSVFEPAADFRRSGFTLIELLVCIGVIGILMSLLLVSMRKVREASRSMACTQNLRQLISAFHLFANDHDRRLPGGVYDMGNTDPDKRDWLMGAGPGWNVENGPQKGTIFKYVNRDYNVYRCPSLTFQGLGLARNSNGRFDYAAFLSFAGARLANVRSTSRYTYQNGSTIEVPTPVIVEEDPAAHLNGSIGGFASTEGGHASIDRLAHTHMGKANYASIDGSVHQFDEPYNNGQGTYQWHSRAPSGNWRQLSGLSTPWGSWDTQ